jgi:hypothetical protein
MSDYDGLHIHLGNLSLVSEAETRSISPENPTGEHGGGARAPARPGSPARDLGPGWKTRAYIDVPPGETAVLADVAGPGAIQSIWMTPANVPNRDVILRFYWDGQEHPSVEAPLGDFFASPYTSFEQYAPLSSLVVCVNPGNAYNCCWPMPFRKHAQVTAQNLHQEKALRLFYQINYALSEVPADAGCFHAQFRRTNPIPYGRVYTVLDTGPGNTAGPGHYVGTAMAWHVKSPLWWGEGEIKFYIDDDLPPDMPVEQSAVEHGGESFPTICGTGTEDYFCGSYNFENKREKRYQAFTTPYSGLSHVIPADRIYEPGQRFAMYRWHIPDPIRFRRRLAVTIQALGWRNEEHARFLPLQDDIASVAYWYAAPPTQRFPPLPGRGELETA